MKLKPLVSVCITTYYHEKYIAQALDSVLSQTVCFDYEICISDDASKDGTVNILLQYAAKNPNIRLNLNQQNVGLTHNFYIVYTMARGKYIVVLSGDDYYIDKNKLQKQFDFLEADHTMAYSGVATYIEERLEDEIEPQAIYPHKRVKESPPFTLKCFLKGNNYPLNGIMTRNYWLSDEGKEEMGLLIKASNYIDDITLSILYLQKGVVHILPNICTAYRVHKAEGDNHNYNSVNCGLSNFEKHVNNLNYLDLVFENLDFYFRYRMVVRIGLSISLKKREFSGFYRIYKKIPLTYRKRGLLASTIISMIPRLFQRLFA